MKHEIIFEGCINLSVPLMEMVCTRTPGGMIYTRRVRYYGILCLYLTLSICVYLYQFFGFIFIQPNLSGSYWLFKTLSIHSFIITYARQKRSEASRRFLIVSTKHWFHDLAGGVLKLIVLYRDNQVVSNNSSIGICSFKYLMFELVGVSELVFLWSSRMQGNCSEIPL